MFLSEAMLVATKYIVLVTVIHNMAVDYNALGFCIRQR